MFRRQNTVHIYRSVWCFSHYSHHCDVLVKVKSVKGKSLKGSMLLVSFQDVFWNQQETPSHSHFLQDKLAASQLVGIIRIEMKSETE